MSLFLSLLFFFLSSLSYFFFSLLFYFLFFFFSVFWFFAKWKPDVASLRGGRQWPLLRRARQKFTFPRCIPAPLPRSGSGGRSVRPPGRRRRAPELGGGGRWEGGRGRKQRKSSGFCCCRGWIAASGASSFSLPALQPSPRSGYNNVLLFGTLSVARTSAGTRGRGAGGLKSNGRGAAAALAADGGSAETPSVCFRARKGPMSLGYLVDPRGRRRSAFGLGKR